LGPRSCRLSKISLGVSRISPIVLRPAAISALRTRVENSMRSIGVSSGNSGVGLSGPSSGMFTLPIAKPAARRSAHHFSIARRNAFSDPPDAEAAIRGIAASEPSLFYHPASPSHEPTRAKRPAFSCSEGGWVEWTPPPRGRRNSLHFHKRIAVAPTIYFNRGAIGRVPFKPIFCGLAKLFSEEL
jgi:hypothetical protein